MCGIRAWLSYLCPKFGNVALLLIVTSATFMAAIVNDTLAGAGYRGGGSVNDDGNYTNISHLLLCYLQLLAGNVRLKKPLFLLTAALTAAFLGYSAWAYSAVYDSFRSSLAATLAAAAVVAPQ